MLPLLCFHSGSRDTAYGHLASGISAFAEGSVCYTNIAVKARALDTVSSKQEGYPCVN